MVNNDNNKTKNTILISFLISIIVVTIPLFHVDEYYKLNDFSINFISYFKEIKRVYFI
jgi:hypothetical protein